MVQMIIRNAIMIVMNEEIVYTKQKGKVRQLLWVV